LTVPVRCPGSLKDAAEKAAYASVSSFLSGGVNGAIIGSLCYDLNFLPPRKSGESRSDFPSLHLKMWKFKMRSNGASPALTVLLFAVAPFVSLHAASVEPPGLGSPGTLLSVAIETGRAVDGVVTLAGRDASQQLLVSGKYSTGQQRNLNAIATYHVQPAGIVKVDSTGWVTTIAEGEATIEAEAPGGIKSSIVVRVTGLINDIPVNFPNEVVPVFTKYSCNSGGCHGKSGGQNGFALALLGFEPTEDYEHLVNELRGRRLFPGAPDRSLLLLKASGGLPHGGGARFDVDSPPYRMIHRWVEQGMPYGEAEDPVVTRIEAFPKERLMPRDGKQQLLVVAHYSDGSTRDVTRVTQFDANEEDMGSVSETGLVSTAKSTGTLAVMMRYQSHVDVFRGTVPLGIKVDTLPPSNGFIDDLVFQKLIQLGLPPSGLSRDGTFLRRVTIDIAGRLPTQRETEQFLADQGESKRSRAIDRLLSSTDYADYFANKWGSILRNKRANNARKLHTYGFHDWIRRSLHENKPYDQFVREVITASGDSQINPPVNWYNEVKDQSAQLEDTAQLFLGLRIQCARCHHHPFEKWSQDDYYGFAAFFSRVGRKPSPTESNRSRIFHQRGLALANNPKTGKNVQPTGLGGKALAIPADEDPREQLADWMSRHDNPFFARALVNRYWKHFFGRGLVDPEDDMRVTNPASNPALLDALADDFIKSGFDLKHLVRTITHSRTYQLSATPNDYNANDRQNFSRYYPQRLKAEVLLDSIDVLTATPTQFAGLPSGTRAIQLPDNAFDSYFLTVFGRPESASACECERTGDANLAQHLLLLNSKEIQGKLGSGRSVQLANDKREPADRIGDLYRTALSRDPDPEETAIAISHIEKNQENARAAYEDVIWALINTKEFLFNH